MKLHEAISEVLKTQPERAATPKRISQLIAERKLYYRKSDGEFPPASQVSARVNNYTHLFRKLTDGRIQAKV